MYEEEDTCRGGGYMVRHSTIFGWYSVSSSTVMMMPFGASTTSRAAISLVLGPVFKSKRDLLRSNRDLSRSKRDILRSKRDLSRSNKKYL